MGRNGEPTPRELDVLGVLWELGDATVAEVRARLDEPVGYTGVLKLLQILEGKRLVAHRRDGRAYRYRPLADRDEEARRALDRVVARLFRGSAAEAVLCLLRSGALTDDELDRVRRALNETEASYPSGGEPR